MNKQQQLTYDKGISNIPSDILCDDNCLQESMNIVYRDGEHQPIQDPVKLCDDNEATKILCVHKIGSAVDNFIAYYEDGNKIGYFINQDGQAVYQHDILTVTGAIKLSDIQAQIVGKTLVIKAGNISYHLWTGEKYKSLGTKVPSPEVVFSTYSEGASFSPQHAGHWFPDANKHMLRTGNAEWESQQFIADEGSGWVRSKWQQFSIDGTYGSDYQNWIRGRYGELRNKLRQSGIFTDPFVVRYAVELHDGSFVNRSAPILMFPTVGRNEFTMITADVSDGDVEVHDSWMYVRGAELRYKAKYDFREWSDIVKGVRVFVSDFANLAKLDKEMFLQPYFNESRQLANGEIGWVSDKNEEGYNENEYFHGFDDTFLRFLQDQDDSRIHNAPYITVPMRDNKDVMAELMEKENFYKIAELEDLKRDDTNWEFITKLLGENALMFENVVTRTKLGEGFHEKCTVNAESIFSYNSRMILANLQRSFYQGDSHFIGFNGEWNTYDYYVFIEGLEDGSNRVIHHNITTKERPDYFFFYPDTRAKRVKIYINENGRSRLIVDEVLKEHEHLNGSYFLKDIPSSAAAGSAWLDITEGQPEEKSMDEVLSNQLYVSEVNNPWLYEASGNLTAGFGNIIGLSTLTTAISQGQFGKYSLIIFTTEGVYAATVNSEGKFAEVPPPMSREVCNNPDSITQTDGAVFFSSDKGLMVIVGNSSGTDVRCVSEQLSGEFPKVLKTAKIAYDYRDSLLWIVSDSNADEVFGEKCWICNIKTGTFHKSNYFAPVDGDIDSQLEKWPFNGFVNRPTGRDFAIDVFDKDGQGQDIFYSYDFLKGKIEESLSVGVDLTQTDRQVVFSTLNRQFYELRRFTYSYEPGIQAGSLAKCYTVFPNSSNYVLGTQYCYLIPNTPNEVYIWDGQQMTNEKNVFGPTYYNEADNIADKTFDESNILQDIREYVEVDVQSIMSYRTSILYDEYYKRFYLWLSARVVMEDNTNQYLNLYYTSWQGSEAFVDSSHNYHPFEGRLYMDELGFTYRWDATTEKLWNITEDDGSPFPVLTIGSVYTEQPNVVQGEYDENVLLRDLIDARGETHGYVDDLSVVDKGIDLIDARGETHGYVDDLSVVDKGICFYDETNFYYVVSYTGSRYGEVVNHVPGGFRGIALFVNFDNKAYYRDANGSPLNTVLYVLSGTYYKWDANTGKLVPTFIGLSNIVNNYPDTLFHKLGDGLYSLTERPQPEDDTNLYSGVIETRPMKLENGLALKSIMQLRNVSKMDGTVVLSMWGSNNLRSWVKLRAFRNAPWKYYRFRFEFSNMPATDRFAGTMLVTQERRTNKLR